MFIAQIEDLNEDCVKISRSYLLLFTKNKPSKSVTVGSGWFIILNNSAIPKMVIKMFLDLFRFKKKKVLELFECQQGDPYMTVSRNFVCFAPS